MNLASQIEAILLAHPAEPMSVAELAQAIPGSVQGDVQEACHALRLCHRLGRNGANTAASPYRFYLKNDVRASLGPPRGQVKLMSRS